MDPRVTTPTKPLIKSLTCGMELHRRLDITRGELDSLLGESFDSFLGHRIENLKSIYSGVQHRTFRIPFQRSRRDFHLEFCAGCNEPHSDRRAAITYKLINGFVRVRGVTGRVSDTARLPSNYCGWMPSGAYQRFSSLPLYTAAHRPVGTTMKQDHRATER